MEKNEEAGRGKITEDRSGCARDFRCILSTLGGHGGEGTGRAKRQRNDPILVLKDHTEWVGIKDHRDTRAEGDRGARKPQPTLWHGGHQPLQRVQMPF